MMSENDAVHSNLDQQTQQEQHSHQGQHSQQEQQTISTGLFNLSSG